MTIEPIQSEQELLERYARAQRGVIMERSGDFDGDLAELRRVCLLYSARHGVPMPPDEIFDLGY
jgi:hypothetical protein